MSLRLRLLTQRALDRRRNPNAFAHRVRPVPASRLRSGAMPAVPASPEPRRRPALPVSAA